MKVNVLRMNPPKHRFTDGLANETYIVEGRVGLKVLKLYDYSRWQNAEKEATVLSALNNQVPVPIVEAWGDTLVPGRTALLLEYIPNQNASQLRHRLKNSFYVSAAEFLNDLHRTSGNRKLRNSLLTWGRRHSISVQISPFEHYYYLAAEWLKILDRECSAVAKPLAVLLNRMRNHEKYFAKQGNTLLHGDYTPQNLLTNGEKVVAIIDFEKASIGDPNYDVQYFGQMISDHLSSETAAEVFLNSYAQANSLPAYFEERKNFYRYYRAFQRTFRYRNDLQLNRPTEDSRGKINLFLQNLVEYNDPWLSSRCRGII